MTSIQSAIQSSISATSSNGFRGIAQNNTPNNWSGYWQIDAIGRTAVHKSGLTVVFDKKNPLVPISGRYAINVSGIAALAGTIWAGQAGVLVEQALSLWRGV